MRHNIIIFGFPVYLIFFEILFRTFSKLDTSGFIGPTLAAAGLSLLISLTKPKPVDLRPEDARDFIKKGLVIKNKDDERLIYIIWGLILIGILIWYWSCATSFLTPKEKIWMFPKHFVIGLFNYVAGITCSLVKEIV